MQHMSPHMRRRLETQDLEAVLLGEDVHAKAFLHLLSHPADILDALQEVEITHWPRLLRLVEDEERRAEVVAMLDDGDRDRLLDLMPPQEIGQLVREMETDDAADVVGDLEPHEQIEALEQLTAADRAQVERLLAYPEDSAGGIMQLERAQVTRDATVAGAITKVQELVDDDVEVLNIWVVDQDGKLVGYVSLTDLLLHPTHTPITSLMETPISPVHPLVDQEEVAHIFKKYDLISLAVVDDQHRLLGRVVVDDVVDVLAEEAEEDALRAAGTSTEELLYKDQVVSVARIRLPWLAINLLGSLMSAFLLHYFEPVIEQAIIIASFVPVITAMGGNVGTQSATILTRGFATGRLDLGDVPRLLYKEARVGMLMGLVCGTVVAFVAAFIMGQSQIVLGAVVFIAMFSAMTAAASVGALAPAAMERLGIDPAIASGPFVTTANDITGILIYMATAMAFLDQLKG